MKEAGVSINRDDDGFVGDIGCVFSRHEAGPVEVDVVLSLIDKGSEEMEVIVSGVTFLALYDYLFLFLFLSPSPDPLLSHDHWTAISPDSYLGHQCASIPLFSFSCITDSYYLL